MKSRLGEWLILTRGERGESLRTVAERAGVSHVYLSEIEKGHRDAEAMGVTGTLIPFERDEWLEWLVWL